MSKYNSMLGWKVFVFSLMLPCITLGQAVKHLSYSFTDMERTTQKKHGNNFEKVKLKMAFQSQNVGKPDLPVYYYKFYVPKGKTVSEITFKSLKQEVLQLNTDLFPVQHPVRVSQVAIDTVFDVPDKSVYDKDTFYPESQVSVLRSDFVDGDLEIITVAVSPMQYNPKQQKLKLSVDGELLLVFGSDLKLATTSLFKNHTNNIEMIGFLRLLVENPADLPSTKVVTQSTKTFSVNTTMTTWTVPFYEYLIVTTRALKPAFNQFVSWKRQKGYNAGVVCIEDILADPMASGDPLSPTLTDDAGKLRKYLFESYNVSEPKTTYVLLGGDYTVVPIRYGCGAQSALWSDGSGKIPSDLYYSDFNTNWTRVSSTILGYYYNYSSSDFFDYGPEVYVGRLLCNSESDIKTWTAKVLLYEQNPGNGDYSYLSKSLFTEADGLGAISTTALPSIFTTRNSWSESPSDSDPQPYFPKGADVITELNTHYGFYSIFNHGSPVSFGTALMGFNGYGNPLIRYQVTNTDNYTDDNNITAESGNGLDNLTNNKYPMILYSTSCTNMPFDNYNINPTVRNLGASFTVVNKSGGPAFLGNTRDGITPLGQELETAFFNNLVLSPQLGIAEGKSKIGFGLFGDKHWTCLTHNLVGDPETPMWTATPTTFSGATVTQNGSTVTVNTGGVTADRICVMNALNTGYFQVKTGLSSSTFLNVTQPFYVTITKANYIPFRYTPTDVFIQNQTIESTAYLNCQSVSAGYNVTSSQPLGNVVIQSGADITFDATGDVLLDKGFEVSLGASFEVK